MNFKGNILIICLTASALLAPSQKAFGYKVEHQTNNEEIQHLVCVRQAHDYLHCKIENSKEYNQVSIQKTKAIESSKLSYTTGALPASNYTTHSSVAQLNQDWKVNSKEVLILLILLSTFSFWLFLYIKNRNGRDVVLRKNIEALERLWRISNYQ